MVLTGLADADALVLQSAQRRENIDGRDNALTVEVTGEDDLTFIFVLVIENFRSK